MKTGLSITQWASEIERQAKAKSDYIVDTRSLTLNESLELEIQENRFPLQSLAHKQIAQRLDMFPPDITTRCGNRPRAIA